MNGDQDDESVAPQRHFLFCPTQKPDKPIIPPKPPKEDSSLIKTSLKSIKSLTKSATRQGSKSNTKSKEKTDTKESKSAKKESRSKKDSVSDTKHEKSDSSKRESKHHHHHHKTSKPDSKRDLKPDSKPDSKPDLKPDPKKSPKPEPRSTTKTSTSKITLNRQRSNPSSTPENSQSPMMRRGNAHELLKRRETAPGSNSPSAVRKDPAVSDEATMDQATKDRHARDQATRDQAARIQATRDQISMNQSTNHQFSRQVSDPNDVTPVNSPKPVRSRKISTVTINLARSPPPVRMPKPVFEKFKNDMKIGNFGDVVQNIEVVKIELKTSEQNEVTAKKPPPKLRSPPPPKLNLTGLSNLSALPKNMATELPSEAPEPKSAKTPKDKKSKFDRKKSWAGGLKTGVGRNRPKPPGLFEKIKIGDDTNPNNVTKPNISIIPNGNRTPNPHNVQNPQINTQSSNESTATIVGSRQSSIEDFLPAHSANATSPQAEVLLLKDHTMIQRSDGKMITIHARRLEERKTLGEGQFGIVKLYHHDPNGPEEFTFAIKRIPLQHGGMNLAESRETERALRDKTVTQLSMKCRFTVLYLGAMQFDGDIWICMEALDVSLDKFYHKAFATKTAQFLEQGKYIGSQQMFGDFCVPQSSSGSRECCLEKYVDYGRMPETFIGRMIHCVITALNYLKEECKIIHRDIKPSNILLSRERQGGDGTGPVVFKLCDFGIAGELSNSLARTCDVGCKAYMAPERVVSAAAPYDIKSDVWSLGITIIECCTGKYPYETFGSLNIFQQVKMIVQDNSPTLNNSVYSRNLVTFVNQSLKKQPNERPHYRDIQTSQLYLDYSDDVYDKQGVDDIYLADFDLGRFIGIVLDRF